MGVREGEAVEELGNGRERDIGGGRAREGGGEGRGRNRDGNGEGGEKKGGLKNDSWTREVENRMRYGNRAKEINERVERAKDRACKRRGSEGRGKAMTTK